MKLPFLTKNTSFSSFSSNSPSSSSSWPWPSCHLINHKTISASRAPSIVKKPKDVYEPPPRSFSSSSSSSYLTSLTMENPPEIESIENVIKGIKSSKRLIFERRGKSNSILEEATKREDHEEEGFMLLSLESNDPYSDFKESMAKMVKAHAIHNDWRSLEKLLFWFLKVNVKTSHRYIFAAFVNLLLNLTVGLSNVAGEPSSEVVVEDSPSSSSPISFYTSYSSSDDSSSTSVRFLPEKSRGVWCLSSLFEKEEESKDINIDSNCYVSS